MHNAGLLVFITSRGREVYSHGVQYKGRLLERYGQAALSVRPGTWRGLKSM